MKFIEYIIIGVISENTHKKREYRTIQYTINLKKTKSNQKPSNAKRK